ncbi:alpha/beta hydrolase [Ottowia sp.]|jgi:pimeloyl-ACP methyl ester carboxylesterase|uniref:alpha/beta hydrolase n=1 Tax=Ottowia sp. TaxID=1898956 RepID=UPI0025D3D0AC|nr:alpha/beta hydrolase [Ottowia sp.]MBK6613519.1 alpha/beta fold hydrolase [Ottowia sp.]MBK6747377.1 alpha/beta fold hydrolase [Ottowia sp.]
MSPTDSCAVITPPQGLAYPAPHALPKAGRFVETPAVKWLRQTFAVLHATSPAAAAHLSYVLLTRPPRVAERPWQACLRERAERATLPFGRGHLALYSWGSGPTVLLVHGWGARGTHLGKMVQPLVDAGYRVVAFDAPGHGHSSGRSATLPEFAGAVAAVAAHVGEIHTLVAHSFGVSMALWAQLDWGLQARRQVLFSSLDHCKWVTEEFARLMRLPQSVLARGRQLMVERSKSPMDWERLAVGEMLAQTSQPTLLVHDAEDPEVPIEHMFNLMAACPQRPLEVHVTEGLGHHRLLGHREVMDRLVAFIGAPQAA